MPAIARGNIGRQLYEGLRTLWGLEVDRYQDEWKEFLEVNTSKKAFEQEVALSGFGSAAVKTEGSQVTYDEANEFYVSTYRPVTYALAFAITEEAIEDNLYMEMGKRYTKALGWSMKNTKEVVCASILNNAFSGSYLGGDGVALCSTSHPTYSGGGVNANRPATDVDLSETALENAVIGIGAWTDQRGLLMAVKPKKLIVPNANSFAADKLLNTVLKVDSADNTINSIMHRGSIPGGYAVCHYLTDTDAWFITTDAPDGLKYFDRVPLKFSQEGDFDTGNMRFKARMRMACGWTNPLGVYGTQGA